MCHSCTQLHNCLTSVTKCLWFSLSSFCLHPALLLILLILSNLLWLQSTDQWKEKGGDWEYLISLFIENDFWYKIWIVNNLFITISKICQYVTKSVLHCPRLTPWNKVHVSSEHKTRVSLLFHTVVEQLLWEAIRLSAHACVRVCGEYHYVQEFL